MDADERVAVGFQVVASPHVFPGAGYGGSRDLGRAIYTAIYAQPRGELRRQLIACLRRGRSTRMPRSRG